MNLSGNPFDYLLVFFAGILLSFTPCVYPLIPITAGYIGIKGASSRLKGLTLSLIYVTGLAVTYSLLGLVASLTGRLFGSISSHPVAYIFSGAVIIVFGVLMLDVFNISLPVLIKLPTLKKQNYFSTFLLGLISGLIIGPCTTPALGAILVYLATKKNILYGTTLLFTFAYGMGLVLVIVGTFSAALAGLPRSGRWTVYIKRLCAVILIGMGIYFIFIGIRRL